MSQQHDQYPDLHGSRRAMIRAARRAAKIARQHDQPLLLWRDGRIVEVMPDDLPALRLVNDLDHPCPHFPF